MRGGAQLTAGRRRIYLAAFVIAVVASVALLQYRVLYAPSAGNEVTATLVIDFGNFHPYVMPGDLVNFSSSQRGWTYAASSSTNTEYIFNNVTSSNDTVWSLMLMCSNIMNSTLGSNLSFSKVYYPEFGEFLITGIEGVNSTSTLFWQFSVNGQPAAYGAQLQKIDDGAVVVWSLLPQ